ncbi:MAG: hypothetical protein PWP43_854 [Bacillota bacterium]|jgi:sucrose-6F-phosphate phosphohydrolase|nr:hypothetical protein [Bacillota bacterium]
MPDTADKGLDLVLATDLDATLVGDTSSLQRLNAWLAARHPRVFLIYLTGRHTLAAWELIAKEHLLLPDVLVCDLGTIVRSAPGFHRERRWEERFLPEWPVGQIERACAAVPFVLRQRWRPPWRRSYYLLEHTALNRIEAALSGLPVKAVVSGANVDVIPQSGGKGPALHHIVAAWGLPPDRVLVCGDSGNDLDMLSLGYKSAVVGNASLERSALPPGIFIAVQGFAAGILEALSHFGWPVSKS